MKTSPWKKVLLEVYLHVTVSLLTLYSLLALGLDLRRLIEGHSLCTIHHLVAPFTLSSILHLYALLL